MNTLGDLPPQEVALAGRVWVGRDSAPKNRLICQQPVESQSRGPTTSP